MNVYQKLNEARVKLQESNLDKSGKNTHLGFKYFELADFLVEINKINKEIGIITTFSMTSEQATMTVYNAESPEEQIVFTTPIAQAKLQGNASPIQELGSAHTYLRRYLYLMVYEIIEHDEQDALSGSEEKKGTNEKSAAKTLSSAQLGRMYAIAKAKGVKQETVDKAILKSFGCTPEAMTKIQYDKVVAGYESVDTK